ncbi:MAG TPA: glycosyltransferase family 1 protein [Solirubrobacteraceae bacterium]|jgi:glycosyltransferase involved in cell wall biosynthesis|nr:glycosyltransferase family 1 protein [Solirubrobacteraceae bacterium]
MQAPLRVGLNLIFLGERAGGAGRYARELPGALLEVEPATEIELFLSRDAPAGLREEPWAKDVRLTTLPIRLSGPPMHVPAEYLALPALAAARGLDVLHSPANTGPTRTPRVASVVSLLDLIWLHRPEEWEASPHVHRTMRRRVSRAVAGADRIFAISQAACEDIQDTLGVPRERIEVTPLGTRIADVAPMAPQELRAWLDLGDARVVLCLAQKRPYKNLRCLVGALPALDPDVVLVLPGSPTPYERELRDYARELGVIDRLRFPEWLSDEQVEGAYACAEVFVLPSLIEGFGLPVVEAMLRGVPVACSNIPALAEVAGDAALMFDPHRQEEVTAAIARLLDDRSLARTLAERGRARAAAFTWRRTAEATLEGYRRAIASRV